MTDHQHHWLRMLVGTSIVGLGLYGAGNQVATALAGLSVPIQTGIAKQGSALQTAISAKIDADLAPIGELSRSAQALLGEAQGKVREIDIAALNAVVSDAGGAARGVTAALVPIQHAGEQIDKALPDFFDCQQDENGVGNKGCLYYRYSDLSRSADVTLQAIANAAPGIAKSAEKTSAAVATAAPAIAASVAGIAASADGIGQTANDTLAELTKPKTLRQKIEAWVKFGVYMAAKFL